MEKNIQLVVKGCGADFANQLGGTLQGVIQGLEMESNLDLRRIHQMIITDDFAGELQTLSSSTKSGNPIQHTNEDYATAVAKVLLLPRGEEIEILPVFNIHLISGILDDPQSERFAVILHMIHHELCHVHDDNKKLDILTDVWMKHRYSGKENFTYPLAEACWGEYFANRLSSTTAIQQCVDLMIECFDSALTRTKLEFDNKIRSYRLHADLNRLMQYFQRHGEFLVKSAAYVLGYVDGLDKDLEVLAPKVAENLRGSYFESTWLGMQASLRTMWQSYPAGWSNLNVFEPLTATIETYYSNMGLVLSTTENGGTYVNVPFSPTTMPL
jgi:hypothetical protein